MNKKTFICARCKRKVTEYPAISRIDNKSEVCPSCGSMEALNVFFGYMQDYRKKK